MARRFTESVAVSVREQGQPAQAFPSGNRKDMKKEIRVKSADFVRSTPSSSMCIT